MAKLGMKLEAGGNNELIMLSHIVAATYPFCMPNGPLSVFHQRLL